MPTANAVVDNTFANDTEFRAYCQAFEAALLASGFLAVAPDTGQLDLTTVVRPATSTYAGFRIYQAVDPLAVLYPLVVKIEFGVGSGGQTRPMMRSTCATGTNGAGTLTGPTSSPANLINGAIDGSGTARIFGSGLENSCAWAYTHDAPASGMSPLLIVGRLISVEDASPRPGIRWFNAAVGGGNLFITTLTTDGATAWATLAPPDIYPKLDHTLATGGDINNTLVYQGTLYRNTETLTLPVITGKTAELPYSDPDASAFNIDIWGEAHNFVALPYGAIQSGNNQRICVPWE